MRPCASRSRNYICSCKRAKSYEIKGSALTHLLNYLMNLIVVQLFKSRSHCTGLRTGAFRQFVAGGPGQTWTNREGIRVRSYIPDSATDQTRFGAKSDHGPYRLCYGLRRCTPGVAPEALRWVPVRPDAPRLCPGHRRRSPGVTTASHGSRTVKSRWYTVAYEYRCNFCGTYNRYVICMLLLWI